MAEENTEEEVMTELMTMDGVEIEEEMKSITIQVTQEQESAMEAFFQINSWQLIKEKRDITTTDDGSFMCILTLKVTTEQEAAIEAFFQINNWTLFRVETGLTTLTKILQDIHTTQNDAPAPEQILISDGTTVEEVQGLQEVQVTAPGTDGKPQIITVYTEGGGAHGIPPSLLTDGSREDMSDNPQVIIQEITLPDGLTLDHSVLIANSSPTKKITPRGSIRPGDKVYKCHVCNKTFKQAQSFHGHYQSHFGAKPYQCDVCQTGFTLKAALVAHQSIHTGAKPFVCALCNKGFRRKDDMISHMRSHTGEKPYECDICGKKFKYRNQIPKHRRAHLGDKPYKCQSCPKSFTSNIHLRRHERTHSGERPYVCCICTKAFTQCGHLQAHMRIHNDERPYTCSICGRGFREKKVMKKHEALHTSERKYKCEICGKGFLRQSNLELHSVMHQKERDGALLVRPRPKAKKKPDAEMRDFVASLLLNVKKVDSSMQTDSLVNGVHVLKDEEDADAPKHLDVTHSKQQNILSAVFANYTVTQEGQDDSVPTIEGINGGEQYTLVMQDDGTEHYLIPTYDQNATGEEIISQQVEISSGNIGSSDTGLQSVTYITTEDEMALKALNTVSEQEAQNDGQMNSELGVQLGNSVISVQNPDSISKSEELGNGDGQSYQNEAIAMLQ